MNRFGIVILAALSVPVFAQDEQVFMRMNFPDLVRKLRGLGNRVHFIEPAYTTEQALTVSLKIKELESLAEGDLTESERNHLQYLRKSKKDAAGAPRYIGYNYSLFDFQIDEKSLSAPPSGAELLSLCENDPTFTLLDLGTSHVFLPVEESHLARKSSLVLKNASPTQALKLFTEFLEKNQIGFVDLGFSKNYLPKVKGPINLDVKDEPLSVVLTRFTEVFGADLVWTIAGQKGYRIFQFNEFR